MKVKLKCQWDNGEVVLPPGSEAEMHRDQAMALADMGLVEVILDQEAPRPVKPSTAVKAKAGKKTKADETRVTAPSGPSASAANP